MAEDVPDLRVHLLEAEPEVRVPEPVRAFEVATLDARGVEPLPRIAGVVLDRRAEDGGADAGHGLLDNHLHHGRHEDVAVLERRVEVLLRHVLRAGGKLRRRDGRRVRADADPLAVDQIPAGREFDVEVAEAVDRHALERADAVNHRRPLLRPLVGEVEVGEDARVLHDQRGARQVVREQVVDDRARGLHHVRRAGDSEVEPDLDVVEHRLGQDARGGHARENAVVVRVQRIVRAVDGVTRVLPVGDDLVEGDSRVGVLNLPFHEVVAVLAQGVVVRLEQFIHRLLGGEVERAKEGRAETLDAQTEGTVLDAQQGHFLQRRVTGRRERVAIGTGAVVVAVDAAVPRGHFHVRGGLEDDRVVGPVRVCEADAERKHVFFDAVPKRGRDVDLTLDDFAGDATGLFLAEARGFGAHIELHNSKAGESDVLSRRRRECARMVLARCCDSRFAVGEMWFGVAAQP